MNKQQLATKIWEYRYQPDKFSLSMGSTYRLPNGNLIPTGGFLNAERFSLQSRGWIYDPRQGAWLPPTI